MHWLQNEFHEENCMVDTHRRNRGFLIVSYYIVFYLISLFEKELKCLKLSYLSFQKPFFLFLVFGILLFAVLVFHFIDPIKKE